MKRFREITFEAGRAARSALRGGLLGVLLLLCGNWCHAASQEGHPDREVLVIHSYHSGLKWTDDIHEAIKRQFSLAHEPVNMQVEYLDAKRYGGRAFEEQTAALLSLKLAIRRYDVVMVSDDLAFRFALDRRNDLFKDIPIVFCGANPLRAAMIHNLKGITGVVESPAIAETIELALQLHPATREIVVVNRTKSLTGQANRSLLADAIPLFGDRVQFRFFSDLPWNELRDRLQALNPGQLVLLTDVIEDERHGVLSFEESCQRVRMFCPVPIYGLGDYFLGRGIVGGKLLAGSDQGRLAAELALRILDGESADDLPVTGGNISKYMFDSKELQRFDISPNALPQQRVVINQQISVFSIPQKDFFKALGILAGLVLLALFLLRNAYSRYAAERALYMSEERFRGYFDLNLVGMATMSANSQWLEVNDRFCDMVKYTREELQRKSWIDLTHPDDLTEACGQFEALCSGEVDHLTRDKRYVCRDGSIIHVQLSTRALRHADGRLDRLVSIIQDITGRKRTEEALRLDEARLEALVALNQMGDAAVEEIVNFIVSSAISLTKSKIGYLAFVNEAEGTLVKHGWTRGVLKECTMDKASAGYAVENAGLWAEAVRHKKPIIINDYTQPKLVKKGVPSAHTPIERFMGVPLLDHDKVVAILGVGNKTEKYNDADVRQLSLLGQGLVRMMESKRIEQGVRDSEQKYKRLFQQFQTLLDGIPDAIFLLTPELQVVWGNQGAARSLGLDVGALPGQPCYHLWAQRNEACAECPVAKCFNTGEAQEATLAYDDGRIWGMKAFPLKNAAGEVLNVIKMAVDITEKIKLRDEAERAGRLASLGELAAGVAHEINNPNGVLMLNANILDGFFRAVLPHLPDFLRQRGLDSPAGLDAATLDTDLPQLLTDMQDSSKRISRIVKDLKEFVRSEGTPSLGPVDLNEVLKIAIRLTGNMVKKTTSCFEVRYAADLPPVEGDFRQLEQVCINLIVNACQALEDTRGAIWVQSCFDEERRRCVIEVRDEGGGIDPQVLPHITEPFFTTKREQGGTGLGLSVSARIVEEHNGKLEFISLPGQGTTVQVVLPAAC